MLIYWSGGSGKKAFAKPVGKMLTHFDCNWGLKTKFEDENILFPILHHDTLNKNMWGMVNVEKHQENIEILETAAAVAHEIKNPLSLIRANIELLQLDDKNPAHEKNYMSAYRQIQAINNLVMEFIQMTKPFDYHWETVSLQEIIEEAAKEQRGPMERSGIKFSYVADNEIHVKGDRRKLKEVIENLLKNAREATAEGKEIEITSFVKEKKAYITVQDAGEGVSAALLCQLERPFFTTKEGGSGLGLPICKKIIVDHQGSFLFESEEGKGSTVTVGLPIVQPE